MAWHVDNKQTLADLSSRMLENKGLMRSCISRTSITGRSEFVRSSHHWAWKENLENWNERFEEFRKDVVTFDNQPGRSAHSL